MAKARHAFVSKDGKLLPEWLKLSGQVEGLRFDGLVLDEFLRPNIVWLRLSADAGFSAECSDLVGRISNRAYCVVIADIPNDEDALAAFSVGVRGYCNSHANERALKLVAKVVAEGGLWIGESLMQRLVVGVGKTLTGRDTKLSVSNVMALLTAREKEVAEAIAGGACNKEIARLLAITERTVKAHVSTIFSKLEVRDRLQLAIKISMLRDVS